MTQDDRDLGRRFFDEVWNKGRRDAIPEMFAEDGVLHDAGVDSVGPPAFYAFYDRMHATLSAIQVTIHDTIAESDQLCVRWTCAAKHSGDGLGIPATGKSIHVTGISLIRVRDGMIVEGWQNWDMLGLLQQIQGDSKAPTYIAAT